MSWSANGTVAKVIEDLERCRDEPYRSPMERVVIEAQIDAIKALPSAADDCEWHAEAFGHFPTSDGERAMNGGNATIMANCNQRASTT